MEILSPQEFTSSTQLNKIKWAFLAPLLMRSLRIRELNELYKKTHELEGLAFIDAVLNHLSISFEVSVEDLKNIPLQGAFIAVANHPYGGLDGLLMLKLLATARPDFRIMANQLLSKLPNLKPLMLPVEIFKPASGKNTSGIRRILEQLHNDMPVGIFPAGEVSSFKISSSGITDATWKPGIARLLERAKVPVIPIHFSGANSLSFNLLGFLHPFMRTIRLPSELFNKRGLKVKIRIGKPITYNTFRQIPEPDRLAYLRANTYALGSQPFNNSSLSQFFLPVNCPKELISELHPTELEAEIKNLRPARLMVRHDQFEVYLVRQTEAPNVTREIGRLRELTFRKVGEGTNAETDLDWYDTYYHHLFLYDRETKLLAGAYRLGKGYELLEKFGKKGFYLHSLFKIKNEFVPVLKESLELGRSFIRVEYQKKPLPLLLLWKGITTYLEGNPGYKYLIGPVSISNYFTSVSKALIVDFILNNFYDHKLARHILPRKKFRYRLSEQTSRNILSKTIHTISSLDELITRIEPNH